MCVSFVFSLCFPQIESHALDFGRIRLAQTVFRFINLCVWNLALLIIINNVIATSTSSITYQIKNTDFKLFGFFNRCVFISRVCWLPYCCFFLPFLLASFSFILRNCNIPMCDEIFFLKIILKMKYTIHKIPKKRRRSEQTGQISLTLPKFPKLTKQENYAVAIVTATTKMLIPIVAIFTETHWKYAHSFVRSLDSIYRSFMYIYCV